MPGILLQRGSLLLKVTFTFFAATKLLNQSTRVLIQ